MALPAHLPPERVRAVVQLEGGEQALVDDEALSEAAGTRGVMILARLRPPLLHAVLEGVVDEGEEAQLRTAFGVDRGVPVDRIEQVRHMLADRPLGMPRPPADPMQAPRATQVWR